MKEVALRAVKFGITGLIGAGVSYLLFIACLSVMSYAPAAVLSWAGTIGFGFLANRRFTFGIKGRVRRRQHAFFYAVGAILQLGLGLAGYALLLGRLKWDPTLAFLVNTAVNAAFGFAFQSLGTFRNEVTS